LLIHPALGLSKSNLIRLNFRVADLTLFTVYDFHFLLATS
jgi:hypothetical protein